MTDPELIDEKFGDIVDLVIDGGIGGIEPSTVVKCTDNELEIVRQGKRLAGRELIPQTAISNIQNGLQSIQH